MATVKAEEVSHKWDLTLWVVSSLSQLNYSSNAGQFSF